MAGLAGFVAIAAFGGAAAALPSAPNPAATLVPLQRWPLAGVFFGSLAWPCVFLALVVGAPNAVGAVLVVVRSRFARAALFAAGCCLTGWVCLGLIVYRGDPQIAAFPVVLVFALIGLVEIGAAVVRRLWRDRPGGF